MRGGECLQGGEARDTHGGDGRFDAAGDGCVDTSQLDLAEGVADGMGGRRACARHDHVGASGSCEYRNLPRCHVGDEHGDHERRDLVGACLHEFGVEDLDGLETTKPHAQKHAHAVGVALVDDEAGMLYEHLAGGNGELDEAVHASCLLGGHELLRIEILHFACDTRGVFCGVEAGDGPDAGLAGNKVIPAGFDVISKGGEGCKARHHNALSGHSDDPLGVSDASAPPARLSERTAVPVCWHRRGRSPIVPEKNAQERLMTPS